MKNVFTTQDLLLLNNNRSELIFTKNKCIIKQGTFVSQLFYLKKGVVKIILESQNGRNSILDIVEEGNFIALPILNNPDIYPFSVISMTDCEICFIRKVALKEIMSNNPTATEYLLDWYSKDYTFLYDRILKISTLNSYGKLATALLYLTNKKFKTDLLEIVSRQEIADIATISLESCNKILLQLKHDGIINIRKSQIDLLQPTLIEKLCTAG